MRKDNPLSQLMRRADQTGFDAEKEIRRTMRDVQAELSLLVRELNIGSNADDRQKVFNAVRKKIAALRKRLARLENAAIEYAAKSGFDSGLTSAKRAENPGLDIRYSKQRVDEICALVTSEQGRNLAAVFTRNMEEHVIDELRAATVAAMREQAVAGGTMKDLARTLEARWLKAAKDGETFQFVDAGGTVWDTRTYVSMNVRTNAMRVYNDVLVDTISRTGGDLAMVSKGGDPNCRQCFPWEGRILSLTGKTKGFPTYEMARSAGCFHPNCVHTLGAVSESLDADEIALQKGRLAKNLDLDALDESRYAIDQERYRKQGLSKEAARIAVDRDNLTDNIRHGLLRDDARELVDKLTDAQVTAICKDGNPPRFTPTKKATKKDPHAADEKFIRGKRGGVVHISRNATVEDLVKVTGVKDAKLPEPVKVEEPKAEPLPKFKTSKEAAEYIEKTYGIACKGFDKFSVEFCQGMVEAVADVKSHIGDSERLQGVWTFAEYYKKAYQLFRPKVEETVAKYYTGPIDSPENQKRIDALTKKKLRREGITKSSKNYGCAWYIPNSQYASLNGIVLNNTLDTMDRHSEVSSGFKAQGCENPLSTIYHELGHIIDYHLGIVDRTRTQITNDTIKALWNKGRDDVAKNLSRYGSTNPREMIAEAWAEYKMNPKARETALTIGKELDKICAERMKKDV